jgi:hypothetical protein
LTLLNPSDHLQVQLHRLLTHKTTIDFSAYPFFHTAFARYQLPPATQLTLAGTYAIALLVLLCIDYP